MASSSVTFHRNETSIWDVESSSIMTKPTRYHYTEQIENLIQDCDIDTILFDDDLSMSSLRCSYEAGLEREHIVVETISSAVATFFASSDTSVITSTCYLGPRSVCIGCESSVLPEEKPLGQRPAVIGQETIPSKTKSKSIAKKLKNFRKYLMFIIYKRSPKGFAIYGKARRRGRVICLGIIL